MNKYLRSGNDSFSLELSHPIDKESWKVLEDAELNNTEHIYFKTPSGKRVDFIKADVLDKIRAEIEERAKFNQCLNTDRANALCWCLDVIDKYKAESEVETDGSDEM